MPDMMPMSLVVPFYRKINQKWLQYFWKRRKFATKWYIYIRLCV